MGSPNALAYLASPAVVAASAVAGKIVSPFDVAEQTAERTIEVPKRESVASTSASTVEILDGFPETIEGEIIFVDQDNLNTDGIYAGNQKSFILIANSKENTLIKIMSREKKCEKSVWRITTPISEP